MGDALVWVKPRGRLIWILCRGVCRIYLQTGLELALQRRHTSRGFWTSRHLLLLCRLSTNISWDWALSRFVGICEFGCLLFRLVKVLFGWVLQSREHTAVVLHAAHTDRWSVQLGFLGHHVTHVLLPPIMGIITLLMQASLWFYLKSTIINLISRRLLFVFQYVTALNLQGLPLAFEPLTVRNGLGLGDWHRLDGTTLQLGDAKIVWQVGALVFHADSFKLIEFLLIMPNTWTLRPDDRTFLLVLMRCRLAILPLFLHTHWRFLNWNIAHVIPKLTKIYTLWNEGVCRFLVDYAVTDLGDQRIQFLVKINQNLFDDDTKSFHYLLWVFLDFWVALAF